MYFFFHLCVFFGDILSQIFYPFKKKWVVFFLIIKIEEFFVYSRFKFFILHMIFFFHKFLQAFGLTFFFLNNVFQRTKYFNLDKIQFIKFSFMVCDFYILSKNFSPNSRSQKLPPMFSSRIFIVLGFPFMPMIHFELTFIFGFEFILNLHSSHMQILSPASYTSWVSLSLIMTLLSPRYFIYGFLKSALGGFCKWSKYSLLKNFILFLTLLFYI